MKFHKNKFRKVSFKIMSKYCISNPKFLSKDSAQLATPNCKNANTFCLNSRL